MNNKIATDPWKHMLLDFKPANIFQKRANDKIIIYKRFLLTRKYEYQRFYWWKVQRQSMFTDRMEKRLQNGRKTISSIELKRLLLLWVINWTINSKCMIICVNCFLIKLLLSDFLLGLKALNLNSESCHYYVLWLVITDYY